jgi:hypothetical protein
VRNRGALTVLFPYDHCAYCTAHIDWFGFGHDEELERGNHREVRVEPLIITICVIAVGWAAVKTGQAIRTLRQQQREADAAAGGDGKSYGSAAAAGGFGDGSGDAVGGHGGHGHGGGDCGGHGGHG